MRTKRSVGYCTNPDCSEATKKVFLCGPRAEIFECNECRQAGQTRSERGFAENTQSIFKEVRVAYNFSPNLERYHATVIVRDESLWGHHNIYHYSSPIICAEKRAFQVAEQILATLNQMSELPVGNDLPNFFESRLSWDVDREAFKKECDNWGASLVGTPLSRSE